MNKTKSKKKIKSFGAIGKLTTFAILLLVVILICSYFTSGGSFSYVKTVFNGNGEYNYFWNTISGDEFDYPTAITEAETIPLPFEYSERFGEVEYSQIALLVDEDGLVYLDKDADRTYFPASLTKIMSAIIVYENIPDLSVGVTLDEDIFTYCSEENAAIAGYSPGETVSALDLLYGMLLPSGAECALGLAQYIAGSEEGFAVLMNEKAAELGLKDTNFVTCTGLHNVKHYTTANDLMVIFKYALDIPLLREIMSTYSYCSVDASYHTNGIWLVSSLGRTFNKANMDMGIIEGGKTGYTDNALLCLASFAYLEVNGENKLFMLITLGAGDGTATVPYHIYDADSVFNSVKYDSETEIEIETEP